MAKPFGGGGTPGGASGAPGGDSRPGGAVPWYMGSKNGGNDICHCFHVEKLMKDMIEVRIEIGRLHGRVPLIPTTQPSSSPQDQGDQVEHRLECLESQLELRRYSNFL